MAPILEDPHYVFKPPNQLVPSPQGLNLCFPKMGASILPSWVLYCITKLSSLKSLLRELKRIVAIQRTPAMPSLVSNNFVNQPARDRRHALQQVLEGLEAPFHTIMPMKNECQRWENYMDVEGQHNNTQQFETGRATTLELKRGKVGRSGQEQKWKS